MTTKRRREQAAFPIAGTRIRGRLRGLETVWTLDRFAEEADYRVLLGAKHLR